MAQSLVAQPRMTERAAFVRHGSVGLLLGLALLAAAGLLVFLAFGFGLYWLLAVAILLGIVGLISFGGEFILQPNQAAVIVFLGRYRGSVKKDGWFWTNPLARKDRISLRVNNFNTDQLKVNDADANPIEVGAVIVWRVVDTARAAFDVESYEQFVRVQSDTSLRHLATQYPYDRPGNAKELSLRGNADEIAHSLREELQSRLQVAGIEVLEARLTHLAYSPEIAGAMLQRQQAQAIVAARQQIVQGAVGMVESVLLLLKQKKIVDLTSQQKAEIVGSLLVVLTSDRGAQPVLATSRAG